MKTFLETSALVALHFRSEKQAALCRAELAGKDIVVSAYVIFELARGFLARLIELHELSYNCTDESDLREMIKAGRAPWTRQRDTWADALDDDLLRVRRMRMNDAQKWRARSADKIRARLRLVIEEGWAACKAYTPENPCGCRADLPAPCADHENFGHVHHHLPTAQCGTPGNCGLLQYVRTHRGDLGRLMTPRGESKAKRKEPERKRRREGIAHLLAVEGDAFDGGQCHSSADAIISHEARGHAVATKDKDLKPICKTCGTEFVPVPHQ